MKVSVASAKINQKEGTRTRPRRISHFQKKVFGMLDCRNMSKSRMMKALKREMKWRISPMSLNQKVWMENIDP